MIIGTDFFKYWSKLTPNLRNWLGEISDCVRPDFTKSCDTTLSWRLNHVTTGIIKLFTNSCVKRIEYWEYLSLILVRQGDWHSVFKRVSLLNTLTTNTSAQDSTPDFIAIISSSVHSVPESLDGYICGVLTVQPWETNLLLNVSKVLDFRIK